MIFLTFTAESVCEVVSVPYVDAVIVMHVLLICCMVRECEGARLTEMMGMRGGVVDGR